MHRDLRMQAMGHQTPPVVIHGGGRFIARSLYAQNSQSTDPPLIFGSQLITLARSS
jgi:hypothetical protein